jgi:hypothetical protein
MKRKLRIENEIEKNTAKNLHTKNRRERKPAEKNVLDIISDEDGRLCERSSGAEQEIYPFTWYCFLLEFLTDSRSTVI